MSDTFAPLLDWLSLNPHWAGAGVFLIILVECMALIGVLWPGVMLTFPAALLAGQAGMPLVSLALLAWLAAFAGNGGSYLLGTRLQNGARSLPLLRNHPQWLAQAEVHLSSYGAASLLVGHFVGPLRPVLPLLAGMLRMPTSRFFLINLCASGLWALATVLPGWLAGAALENSPPAGFWLQAALLLTGFALLTAVCLQAARRPEKRLRWVPMALSGTLLAALLTCWPWLSRFDLYLQQLALGLSGPLADRIMLCITQLGDVKLQIALDALLCGLLVLYRARTAVFFAAGSLMGATLLNAVLKKLVARSRPDLLPIPLKGYSMPSGHTVRAFTFFLVVAILAGLGRRWQIRIGLVVLAFVPGSLVAFSRVYLTAHWPTDTLASLLLATFSCTAMLALLGSKRLPALLGHRLWALQGSLSLLAFLLFVLWSFSATASKYNLL